MRVFISGGGVAGLTVAYWLHQYGYQSVVLEQADNLRRDGYAIDFFGTGYDVASRMGLIKRLQPQQIPFEYIGYVNRTGKPLARFDRALMQKVMQGKYMALMHWTLEEALYQAIEGTVEVRFGRSLEAVEQDQHGVRLTLNDGTTESCDLLIGADGVHSRTRALVFGPEQQFRHALGYIIASYPLPDRYKIGPTWQMYCEPGRMAAAYKSTNEGEIITFFMYRSDEAQVPPRDQRYALLRDRFAGMGWITQRLLDDLADPKSLFMDTVAQIRMSTWHQHRVTLVGDACDCPTLVSGQGASLAMGGAYLLAQALHERENVQEAFQQYEQQMQPHVQAQQEQARSFAKSFIPSGRLGALLQPIMMKVVLRDAFVGLLRKRFGAESFLSPETTLALPQTLPR